MIHELSIQTDSRNQIIDITQSIADLIVKSNVNEGMVVCFVPHTTAAVTINENADRDVKRDILDKLARAFPQSDGYLHAEGNSDAHIKASLIGSSAQLLIKGGRLVLGTWQGVQFCEFDGPRSRKLLVKVFPDV